MIRLRAGFGLLIAVPLLATGCAHPAPLKNPWAERRTAAPGPAEAIGFYSKGCLQGAESMPASAPGLEMMRISRRRFYGHPDLIAWLKQLGQDFSKKTKTRMLVGDLAQPRGGYNHPGHASHQSGLDVDIYFRTSDTDLSLDDRENLSAWSVVRTDDQGLDSERWGPRPETLIRLAASSPTVERLFVDRWIKKELCRKYPGAPWLSVLRPWWNHQDHLHVRLKCPKGNSRCEKQEPVPAGDGCDQDLAWWFGEEWKTKTAEIAKPGPELREIPAPIPECQAILDAP